MPQHAVARAAGVSQATISRLERGHLDTVSLRSVRRAFSALDARVSVDVGWRGGALDRLLDERHAALVGTLVTVLSAAGWDVAVEVTYSHFGERGSIDVLAVLLQARAAIVAEVKTELTSVEETLRRHDAKVRLAPLLIEERFGWRPLHVSRLLVLPEDRTARRRVARQAALLDRVLPARGQAIREWLRRPTGQLAGLWFLSGSHGRTQRRASRAAGRQIRHTDGPR
jgi:transcriptional regulator with XRE-family HTH domain